MKNLLRRLALILLFSIAGVEARCDSVTIGASKDNTLFRNVPNNSAGGAAGIFAGTTAFRSPRRGLIAFDVAAHVPAGARIVAAELTLHLGAAGGGESQLVGLHRLLKDWGEGEAGSSMPTVRYSGNGFAADLGDATWTYNFYGASLWSNPGAAGDYAPLPSANALIDDSVDTAFTWLTTPALVGDVQSWLDNPSANFGWMLLNANETDIATVRAFYSRSATVDAGGDPLSASARPALRITYVVPEPAAWWMALWAAFPLWLFRRAV